MKIKRVKLSDALTTKGKSREGLLKNMSPAEIHRRACADPDNPPLTETQLKEFVLSKNKGKKNDKKS